MSAGRTVWISGLLAVGAIATLGAGQGSSFEQLLERYRGDDAPAAIREFAKWPDGRVELEAKVPASHANDPRAIARLALFHMEAGVERGTFGRVVAFGLIQPAAQSEVHYRSSFTLVEALDANPAWRDDPHVARFIDDWFLAAHTSRVSNAGIPSFERYITAKQFRSSAQAQLQIGMLNMRRIGPTSDGVGPLNFSVDHTDRTGLRNSMSVGGQVFDARRVREAELGFTRALELNPRLADARLRLGRLQHIVHRPKDAAANLDQAWKESKETGDKYLEYLAAIFAGQAADKAKRPADALTWYERALAVEPRGPVALLGAGHARMSLGMAAAGNSTIARIFEDGGGHTDPSLRFEELHDTAPAERWARMRAWVSATPFIGRAQPPVQRATVSPPVMGQTAASGSGLSVVLLLDTSGSMMRNQSPSLGDLASIVVDALGPADSISIVSASDRISLHARNVNQRMARQVLANIPHEPTSDTVLFDAALASRALLAGATGRPLIFLITDGADTASSYTRSRAIDAVASRAIPFDAIELKYGSVPECSECSDDRRVYGEITPRPFALKAGGRWFLADSPRLAEDISRRFDELRRK